MKNRFRKGGLLSILLATMLLIVGCGAKTSDAKAVYTAAMEQTQKLDSLDCSMQMDMTMNVQGQTYDVKIDLDMLAENVSSATDLKMSMNMVYDMGTLGSDTTKMYYGDGYIYMDTQGLKVKAALSSDQFEGASQGVIDVSADLLSDLKSEVDGDNTIVSYSCSGEAITELMNQLKTVGDASIYEGMSLESAEGTLVINKDGYITSQTLNMLMNYDYDGETYNYDMKMVITYNNPGKEVTVEMPDASEYTEMDANLLGY